MNPCRPTRYMHTRRMDLYTVQACCGPPVLFVGVYNHTCPVVAVHQSVLRSTLIITSRSFLFRVLHYFIRSITQVHNLCFLLLGYTIHVAIPRGTHTLTPSLQIQPFHFLKNLSGHNRYNLTRKFIPLFCGGDDYGKQALFSFVVGTSRPHSTSAMTVACCAATPTLHKNSKK